MRKQHQFSPEQFKANMADLPEIVLIPLPPTADEEEPGTVAAIKRGVAGFYPFTTHGDALAIDDPALFCENYNTRMGVKPSEVEAMKMGSMFGWDLPGANPSAFAKLDAMV